MHAIRRCREDENATILAIVNAAAEAYREVIPPDRWHDPYMTGAQLKRDIAAGIEFWGYELEGALIGHLRSRSTRRLLVGTWADAAWAIRFYQREGFELVPAPHAAALLKSYWDIPERQIETSVVLERK